MGKLAELVQHHRIALEQYEKGSPVERLKLKKRLEDLQEQMLDCLGASEDWDLRDETAYRWLKANE